MQVNIKCCFQMMISFIKGKKAVQTHLALREKLIAPPVKSTQAWLLPDMLNQEIT